MKRVILSDMASDKVALNQSSEHLNRFGIVNATHFFDESIIKMLQIEMEQALVDYGVRKDFLSEHTDGTPRHMFTVNKRSLDQSSPLFSEFYHSKDVLKLLKLLACLKVNSLPWDDEKYLINALIKPKDVHGWHWDDYAYAFVFIGDCPPEEYGGNIECVPHSNSGKEKKCVYTVLENSPVSVYHFTPGSFYFMRSDRTLHRVAPIKEGYRRISLTMSYCDNEDLKKDMDHKTIYDLYG